MQKIVDLTVRRIQTTFTWLRFTTWTKKEEYTLIRFDDKLLGKYIMWVYIYENHMSIEFRETQTAKIDKEFRNIDTKRLPAFLKSIRYIY